MARARLRKPIPPRRGDRVALLAPASPLKGAAEVEHALDCLRRWGYEPKPYPSLHAQQDYLAGPDALRAGDLAEAFADDSIAAIFCLRGGYGSARLLPLLDWRAVCRRPKLLVGFSDLTSVQSALLAAGGLGSWHAPTMSTFIRPKDPDTASEAILRRALEEGLPPRLSALAPEAWNPSPIVGGRARGILIGGNLTVFAALCGTPWMPSPDGTVLFLEDINEKPYRLDRCVTQLANAGYLARLSGIVLGQFTGCAPGSKDRDGADAVLARCLRGAGVPVLAGIPAGHGSPSVPLPIGAMVELDADGGEITLLEE